MLDELSVRNLGIIAEAGLEPGPGLVVVSGETGTGKTLLLGALRLLLGETARRDQVGPADEELRVDARFVFGDAEHVATRRVNRTGRSRAYLDGTMVTASALAERTAGMVEIVGQHDHLALASAAGLRRILDGALDADDKAALARYVDEWERYRALVSEAEVLGGDRRAIERELDMARFQADEIAAAGFEPGDDVSLGAEADRLRNAEAILERLSAAAGALGEEGAGVPLGQAAEELQRATRLDPGLSELADQAAELAVLAGELASAVVAAGDQEHHPQRLAEVEARVALLGDLRRKYGSTLDEVLAFGESAAARADELAGLLDRAAGLEAELEAAKTNLVAAGEELTSARVATADRLAAQAVAHLQELGFTAPVVSFRCDPIEPSATGLDRIGLAFASDASLEPGPVSRIASGGELSRLVLSLRLAAGVADASVLAFDEIDAGVGGTTALAMGRKLAALAEGRQVLCVTHLPQVAAFADAHLVIERTGGTAVVRSIAGEARLEELSRMLAGMPGSEKGKDHAAELLASARRGG